MTCHSHVWVDSPMLRAVRESFLNGTPLAWVRVHDLPDFTYFNHSIHVRKGIGCETCHGRVDQMALTYQAKPLTMSWCLDCHRSPERYVRPREHVFTMGYAPRGDRLRLGRELLGRDRVKQLTDCSVCHR